MSRYAPPQQQLSFFPLLSDAQPEPVTRHLDAARPAVVALRLPGAATGALLAGLATHLGEGGVAYCFDANNRFDPRPLVEVLSLTRYDPWEALDRLMLSRTFTCHQLVEALETMMPHRDGRPRGRLARPDLFPELGSTSVEECASPKEAEQREVEADEVGRSGGDGIGGGAGGAVVFVLGVDTLFLDDDLPQWERTYLFGRVLDALKTARQAGLRVIATYGSGGSGMALRHDQRPAKWGARLRAMADVALRAEESDDRRLFIEAESTGGGDGDRARRYASPPDDERDDDAEASRTSSANREAGRDAGREPGRDDRRITLVAPAPPGRRGRAPRRRDRRAAACTAVRSSAIREAARTRPPAERIPFSGQALRTCSGLTQRSFSGAPAREE